jgi:hypothetical protein
LRKEKVSKKKRFVAPAIHFAGAFFRFSLREEKLAKETGWENLFCKSLYLSIS